MADDAFDVGGVEDGSDDVEGAPLARAGVEDVHPDPLALAHGDRVGLVLVGVAVEDDQVGVLGRDLVGVDLAAGGAEALAARLPRSVVGTPEEFEARVQQARSLYLPDGRVSEDQLETTVTLLRDQMPLRSRPRIQLLPPGRLTTTPSR